MTDPASGVSVAALWKVPWLFVLAMFGAEVFEVGHQRMRAFEQILHGLPQFLRRVAELAGASDDVGG